MSIFVSMNDGIDN